MNGSDHGIRQTDTHLLARLMGLEAGGERLWRPEELAAILRHQMTAPVEFDLTSLGSRLAGKVKTLAASEGLLVRSFADLFQHPHPPIELLQLTKQFAKASRHHPDSPLPREVATLLYFASIIVAMMKCGRRITRLDDAAVRRGLQWLVAQPWVDEPTRALFREGLEFLRQREQAPT